MRLLPGSFTAHAFPRGRRSGGRKACSLSRSAQSLDRCDQEDMQFVLAHLLHFCVSSLTIHSFTLDLFGSLSLWKQTLDVITGSSR